MTMRNVIPIAAAGVGLMLSPDHLRMWGNLAGGLGVLFCLAAVAAMSVYMVTGRAYQRLNSAGEGAGGYLAALDAAGGCVALSVAVVSRLVMSIALPTGVLVTAGFVFNETFIYWFPNFAFAFLYLGGLALILCWGYGVTEKVQLALVLVCLSGVALLAAVGAWQGISASGTWPTVALHITPPAMAAGLSLFVGFDMGIHRPPHHGDIPRSNALAIALMTISLFMGVWQAAALMHVPPGRLADSFIPHTLAARSIAGQAGRMVMGVSVIAGAGAAVLALFTAMGQLVTSLATMRLLPPFCRGNDRRQPLIAVFLSAAVAAMMAMGVAGEPILEVLIRAGFLLWMLHVAMIHGVVIHLEVRRQPMARGRWRFLPLWPDVLSFAVIAGGATCLWMADDGRLRTLSAMAACWLAVLLVLVIARRMGPVRSGQ